MNSGGTETLLAGVSINYAMLSGGVTVNGVTLSSGATVAVTSSVAAFDPTVAKGVTLANLAVVYTQDTVNSGGTLVMSAACGGG